MEHIFVIEAGLERPELILCEVSRFRTNTDLRYPGCISVQRQLLPWQRMEYPGGRLRLCPNARIKRAPSFFDPGVV